MTGTGVNPGAGEIPYDGIDQDCGDGDVDDLDGDGESAVEAGGQDCDDADSATHSDADETWSNGATDNDCDGDIESVRLDFGAFAWVGPSAGAQAGRRLGALGDVNGDGLAEYLVGAVYEGGEYTDGGAVYLVEGGAAPGSLGDLHVLLPGGASWYLPAAVEGGPDIDDDGVPDFVASTVGYESFTGAAFLVSGSRFATETQLMLPDAAFGFVRGDAPGDLAGAGGAFLGDVMGDGAQYLGVSSVSSDSAFEDAGSFSVLDVATVSASRAADGEIVVEGYFANATIGNTVQAAGDVNGDGVDDYMVSASGGDLAYVLPGGLADPDLSDDALFRLRDTGAGDSASPRCSATWMGTADVI